MSPFYTMVLAGPDLMVETSSPAQGGLFGEAEVVGRRLEDLCREPELRVLLDAVKTVHHTGRTWTSDSLPTPIIDAEGNRRLRDLVYTVVPTHAASGSVDGAVIYCEDVTLRRIREEEQQRERLRLMIEHAAQVALALFDGRTKVLLYASPRYVDLVQKAYDAPRGSVLGRSWDELSLLGQEAGELFVRARESGRPEHRREVRVTSRRGETFWDCSLIPIQTREGSSSVDVRYIVVSAVEVTEQVEARERLRELDRLKDQFLSLASHELRTPLVPLRTYAEILARRAQSSGDHELASVAAKFEKQILHLTRLTDDLLDVARLENGKLSLEFTEVDLRQTAREAASRLASQHPAVEVRLDLPEAPVLVRADEDRVVQVLSNLLDNAVTHGRSPRIDLRVRMDGDQRAEMEVEDYGVGIPPGEHEAIFDRLHQASLPHRASRPGLGLGLFIARELVEQHGGELRVSSEVGKGSIFTIRLPVQEGEGYRPVPGAADSTVASRSSIENGLRR
jgi:signal transduction histidine kinase